MHTESGTHDNLESNGFAVRSAVGQGRLKSPLPNADVSQAQTHSESGALGCQGELLAAVVNQQPWHVQYFLFHVAPVQPWMILANARAHLADQIMEVGDVEAWWDLGQIQDELLEEASGL